MPIAGDPAAVFAERRRRHEPPHAQRDEAEHEHGHQPTEQAHRHDLLVDQILCLLLQLVGLALGRFDPLLDLLPAAELGDEVAGRVEIFRQAELVAAGHRRFDLRAVLVLARAMDFQLVLGRLRAIARWPRSRGPAA